MSNKSAIHISPILKQRIIDCLLGDEPMFNAEIMEATGCTKWQVTYYRQDLNKRGFNVKTKKVAVKKTTFVISGNTEAERPAKSEPRRKSKERKRLKKMKLSVKS